MPDRTESLDPYEPQPSYEWDYEDEPSRRPKILWGRVLALGAFIVLAFLVGRWTAPEPVSQSEFDAVRADLADAREEIAQLQAQVETTPTASPSPAQTPGETTGEGETYLVRSGDTLRDIALEQYGDAALDDCIAEANDIPDPTELPVGETLIIPPEEDC
ncbi:MAG: LysM peptidoglycan-binding domain-containing protein [Actinomycetota bacterium]